MSEEEATYTIKGSLVSIDGKYVRELAIANKRLSRLEEHLENAKESKNRFKAEMHRWEAKYRQVAHENNQLRKALHQ